MNRSLALETLQRNFPAGADAALIISPVNRRYYTGMPSTDGALLVTPTDAVLLVDFRYIERARQVAAGCEVVLRDRLFPQLRALLEARGARTLAVETERMTVAEFSRLRAGLPGIMLRESGELDREITRQRAVKTPGEIESVRAAQRITDRSFTELLNFLRPGITERQAACELVRLMREFGSEGEAFDTIAVAGPNSSMPHGVPTDRPLAAGDFFTLDFGAKKDGYCSDMTRTVAIGYATDEMRQVYDTVLRAQRAALAVIRPGVSCREIDGTARQIIEEEAGYRGCFGHSLGHSLGLEIHESPVFSPLSQDTTQAGNLLSVEPGIYLEGRFGVRIEDIVWITESGCENLTGSAKELLVL